jgi:hypothetical protein
LLTSSVHSLPEHDPLVSFFDALHLTDDRQFIQEGDFRIVWCIDWFYVVTREMQFLSPNVDDAHRRNSLQNNRMFIVRCARSTQRVNPNVDLAEMNKAELAIPQLLQ